MAERRIPMSDKLPPLENIIAGLILTEATDTEKSTSLDVFILPTQHYDGMLHGTFIVDGKTKDYPLGIHWDANSKTYFLRLSKKNNLWPRPLENEVVYLPVESTSLNLDSDYKFAGVRRGENVHPLVMVDYTASGLIVNLFIVDKTNKLKAIESNDYNPIILEVSEALRRGDISSIPSLEGTLIASEANLDWLAPKTIVYYLDHFVVGQPEAKRTLAVAFSNYMRRMQTGDDKLPEDYNTLLIGPSGVGKTHMIKTLAQKADIPWVEIQLVGKSSEGFVGTNLSAALYQQIRAKTDEQTPYGVIFLDEFDKIAQGRGFSFGPRLQDELIGILEEGVIHDSRTNNPGTPIYTKNLMFVAAGAFQGSQNYPALHQIVKDSLQGDEPRLGFLALSHTRVEDVDLYNLLSQTTPEHLIAYGFKPELIGRIGQRTILHQLTFEQKTLILRDMPDSPIKTYIHALELEGYTIEVDPAVPAIFAGLANDETGARDLKSVANRFFRELQFDPGKYAIDGTIRVNQDLISDLVPEYKPKPSSSAMTSP